MVLLWAAAAAAGLALAATASARGVEHAARVAGGLGVPSFLVGFTLVAIGTDLPEIANSIAASVAGHGDINVGDSIGSSAAQGTLVIGLVPLAASQLSLSRRNIAMLGAWSVAALLLGVLLMLDGRLGRTDGLVLIATWGVAMASVWRRAERPSQPELPLPSERPYLHGAVALGFFLVVAAGATLAVVALTRIAALLDVPEYLVSFLGLALGTSLPELTVAVTAARQGRGDLALGNVLGATLADASLSVGSGPVIAPTAVTTELVVRGGLVTAVAVAVVTLVLVAAGRHTRTTGVLAVLVYAASVPVLTGAV